MPKKLGVEITVFYKPLLTLSRREPLESLEIRSYQVYRNLVVKFNIFCYPGCPMCHDCQSQMLHRDDVSNVSVGWNKFL